MPLAAALLLTLVAVQDGSPSLLDRLNAAPRAAAVRTVQGDPDAARRALDALIARVDASVHSDRDHPEQRRVVYDRDALALGRRTGEVFAAATGDRTYARRFAARQQRLTGTELLNARRYRAALTTLGGALREAQALGDTWLEVITRINLAYGRLQLGNGALALEQCQRAADLAARVNDRARALALFNLGSMHLHLAHARESIAYSRQAADLSRRVGIKLWEGNSLLNIGAAHVQLGEVPAAHDAFDQALQVLQQTTDRLGTGRAWYNLGLVAMQQQQPAEAARCMERALPIIRTVDIRHSHDIELDRAAYQNPIELSALDVLVQAYGALGDTAKRAATAAELERVKAAQPASAAPHRHGGGQ
jgi:tetratricopeptide (TPR) repeat protein